MSEEVTINRKHKDRLFTTLFGDARYRNNMLSLYNALNGTHYAEPDDLEITTIEDVLYMKMKNDVSFIFRMNEMNLWEEQSTPNPNMPVRGLMYFAKLYDKYIQAHDLNVYGTKRLILPTPHYMVFYLGDEDTPDRMTLRLSDSFEGPDKGCIELTAEVININSGHNEELMDKCEVLRDYSTLISRIRINKKTMEIEEAVNLAVDSCINEGILKDFLIEHKAEVNGMLLTEYNEEKTMKAFYRDGFSDGFSDGFNGAIKKMLKKGKAVEDIADDLDISIDQVKNIQASLLITA